MLVFNEPSLPESNSPFLSCAPAIVLPKAIAPAAVIDIYADYRNINFTPVDYPTPDPSQSANYYRIGIGLEIAAAAISSHLETQFPIDARVNEFWVDETEISLVTSAKEGDSFAIALTVLSTIPINFAGDLTVEVPQSFTVSRIGCPDKGIVSASFVQDGTRCAVSDPLLEFGDECEVVGILSFTLPAPQAIVLFFDFSQPAIVPEILGEGDDWETEDGQGVEDEIERDVVTENWEPLLAQQEIPAPEIVDYLEYLGSGYTSVESQFNPIVGEFFWVEGFAKAFADPAIAPFIRLAKPGEQGKYYKSVGVLTF